MSHRSARIVSLLLVTLLAGLPGGGASAAGAGVRVTVQLHAPVATLRCPACVIGEAGPTVQAALRVLLPDSDRVVTVNRVEFLRRGAAIGTGTFAGSAVELRQTDAESGKAAPRFIAL